MIENRILETRLLSFRPAASQGSNESFGMMGSHNDAHDDSYENSSQDSTLMMREVSRLSVWPLTWSLPPCWFHTNWQRVLRRSFTDLHAWLLHVFVLVGVRVCVNDTLSVEGGSLFMFFSVCCSLTSSSFCTSGAELLGIQTINWNLKWGQKEFN